MHTSNTKTSRRSHSSITFCSLACPTVTKLAIKTCWVFKFMLLSNAVVNHQKSNRQSDRLHNCSLLKKARMWGSSLYSFV